MRYSPRKCHSIKLLAACALFLSACTAHKKPSTVEATLANIAKDIVIPIEAENLKNPLPVDQQVVAKGRDLYVQSCAVCHGPDGHGQTSLGLAMYPPAMDLTSPHVQHWREAELFWIIQNGVRLTGMPSWKNSISPEDTWKLVVFIYELPKTNSADAIKGTKESVIKKRPDELIAYGKTLYRQEGCFICHPLNGEGGKVGPDLSIEGTRGRTTPWLIGHLKDPPAFVAGSIMPPFKNLTDEQLNAIAAFLLSQKGVTGSKKNTR